MYNANVVVAVIEFGHIYTQYTIHILYGVYVQVYSNSNVGKKCSEKIIVGPQEVQNS